MCRTNTRDCEVVESEKKKSHSATVEEALTMTGFGKYNIGLLLVCSWTLQAMGMDMFGTSFVVAAAVCDLQLTMQQRALLTAMPLLGVVVGAQFWGYVADTKGRKLSLVLSMSIGFVFAALSSFSPNWQVMAVLKLISSTLCGWTFSTIMGILSYYISYCIYWPDGFISTSASNSGAYTLLGESCSELARGKAMLLCTCALMCSQATVAVFAYPILPLEFSYHIDFLGITYRSWRLLALVMSLPCAATACLLQLFHESPKFLATQGRYEEALRVLQNIYVINTGCSADSFTVKKLVEDSDTKNALGQVSFFPSIWQQTAPLFRQPLLKNTLILFYLVAVVYMTGSGFILWLPYIMNNLFSVLEADGGEGMNLCTVIRYPMQDIDLSRNVTGIEICDDTIQETTLFSAMTYGALASSCNLVLSLTCGRLKKQAMIWILIISASCAVLLNVVPVPIAGGIFFFFFMLCALSMGILSVYFVELYPTSSRGMVSCLSVMLGRLFAFAGVNIIGALISTDCETTFYGWACLLLTAICVAWLLPSDRKPKN